MNKFKPGDIVKIKPWEVMEAEFGITGRSIDCLYHVTPEMYEDLKDKEYEIERISDNRIVLKGVENWSISSDMLMLAGENFEYPKCFSVKQYGHKEIPYNLMVTGVNSFAFSALKTALNMFICTREETVALRSKCYNSVLAEEVISVIKRGSEPRVFYSCVDNFEEYISEGKYEEVQQLGIFELQKGESYFFSDGSNCLIILSNALSEDEKYRRSVEFLGTVFSAPRDVIEALKNFDAEGAWNTMRPIFEKTKEEKEREEFKKRLDSIKTDMIKRVDGEMENRIQNKKNAIKDKEQVINNLYVQLHTLEQQYLHRLENKIGEREQEFLDLLFEDYKNVSIIEYDGNAMALKIKTQLLYFEEDDWRYVRNSSIREYGAFRIDLLDALFSRKCILNLETGVYITLYGDNTGITKYNYGYTGEEFPNPHVKEYDCWGDNWRLIKRYLEEGDMALAYLQIKSTLSGLNISDSPVLKKFVKYLQNGDMNSSEIIYIPEIDKTVTIPEADEYFKGKAKVEEEKKNEDD